MPTSFNSSSAIRERRERGSPFERTNIRHTTTIQSFGSESSDISCLDLHFMERVGEGVTRLT